MRLIGFEPVVDSLCRVLVLGTMPGVMSLQKQQYYGNPRNAFWPIVATLAGVSLPEEYDARKVMLLQTGIALWDVCQSCVREGSLDSHILEERPNQIIDLLAATPSIRAVAFNGQPAYRLFKRHIEKELTQWTLQHQRPAYPLLHLPSTSPAYASMSFAQKLERWMQLKEYL